MWFFGRSKRSKTLAEKEAEILAIKKATKKKAELAAKEMEKINKLIQDNPDDIAALIFYATGGYRRGK